MAEELCDIIIIGAGTAGCVLANRLSEDPNISIVVLEAGDNRNDDERVFTPGLAGQLLNNPDFDWRYVSEPQPGLNGRQIKHPRGKVVGGSSAINSFALIYPSAAGMDAWAELGNRGWGWDDMKSYFRKFQTISVPNDDIKNGGLRIIDQSMYETNGPIQATLPLTVSTLQKAWLDTFETLGLGNYNDPLDGAALGGYMSTNHITNDRHERSHAGVAYLQPALDRPNLTLVTGASVQRILFDQSKSGDAVATGVSYIKNGAQYKLVAGKEVILTAGAFASPQLLELSGIGDSSLLQKHDIDVVYHNPSVGENLQDHIRGAISLEAADDVEVLPSLADAELRALYEGERKGPWAESGCFMFAYMPLGALQSSDEKKELLHSLESHPESTPSEIYRKLDEGTKRLMTNPSEATATVYLIKRPRGAPEGKRWITICAMHSYSLSRGSVHITSSNVSDHPKIDFGYYNNPFDLEIHARHMQSLFKLASTAPLAACLKPGGAQWPEYSEGFTLDHAKEHLREWASTNYHPCGTCSMMSEDIGGVVDNRLRVYGTKNVRVIDASITPIIPRGNIITTVYAAAEKAADILSEDLGLTRTT